MSYMFEIYYKAPPDPGREERITETVSHQGGRLTYREIPQGSGPGPVVLTYEFDVLDSAHAAATDLRQ